MYSLLHKYGIEINVKFTVNVTTQVITILEKLKNSNLL